MALGLLGMLAVLALLFFLILVVLLIVWAVKVPEKKPEIRKKVRDDLKKIKEQINDE